MKHGGKRLAFTVAATGLAVLLVLGIVHRDAVRDHIEAWHFQLTTETETIRPKPRRSPLVLETLSGRLFLGRLADYSGRPVILTADSALYDLIHLTDPFEGELTDYARKILEPIGYRVIEQRFPRRAYVVIRDDRDKVEQPAPPGFPSPGILLPPRLEEPVKLEEFEEY